KERCKHHLEAQERRENRKHASRAAKGDAVRGSLNAPQPQHHIAERPREAMCGPERKPQAHYWRKLIAAFKKHIFQPNGNGAALPCQPHTLPRESASALKPSTPGCPVW